MPFFTILNINVLYLFFPLLFSSTDKKDKKNSRRVNNFHHNNVAAFLFTVFVKSNIFQLLAQNFKFYSTKRADLSTKDGYLVCKIEEEQPNLLMLTRQFISVIYFRENFTYLLLNVAEI
jgi:hypothetical protein